MTDIPRSTILSSIKKKGFLKHPKSNQSDHDWYCFYFKNEWYTQINVKISRGSKYKTYSQNLWPKIKNRVYIDTNKALKDLLECPMGYDAYLDVLKRNKLI